MKAELHILTARDDLTQALNLPDEATVFDLAVSEPDYGRLLEMIFEAERVHVW